jgi:DNA-binding XRE family transcriptional regulator
MGRHCLLREGIRRPASYPYCGGRSNNSMGNARPRLKLMPEKLLLIREYLNVSKPVMAQLLELSKTGRVSEYENGVREPNLMVTLAYSRLGK